MKKILLVATFVAIITAGCKSNNGSAGSVTAVLDSLGAAQSGQLAYVDMDTIVLKYDMYTALSQEFETKASKADADLSARQRSLERDLIDYQEKAQKGLLTRLQMQTTEENLTKKQQDFMAQREQVLATLGEEERVMLNQVHYSITEFMKEFNKDYRYAMIVSTSAGSPVLHANPALDITKEVLAGLNKKYAAEKDTQTQKQE